MSVAIMWRGHGKNAWTLGLPDDIMKTFEIAEWVGSQDVKNWLVTQYPHHVKFDSEFDLRALEGVIGPGTYYWTQIEQPEPLIQLRHWGITHGRGSRGNWICPAPNKGGEFIYFRDEKDAFVARSLTARSDLA